MLPRWRLDQIAYNEKALEWLARAAGARFGGREIVVRFYGIVAALDGYAAARGHPAPKSHRERRAIVERHLPHLVDPYDDLYGLSLDARYHRGYAMAEKAWCKAAQCCEELGGASRCGKGMPDPRPAAAAGTAGAAATVPLVKF